MAQELRNEIIESEKAGSDLLRWKLVFTGVLAAVALGLNGGDGRSGDAAPQFPAQLVLCCIPFVCVYVDLLCTHLWLRILVIGRYLRGQQEHELADKEGLGYEEFASKADVRHVLSLEEWTLYWSTMILSIGVAVIGTWLNWNDGTGCLRFLPYWFSGFLGVVLSLATRGAYQSRIKNLNDLCVLRKGVADKPH